MAQNTNQQWNFAPRLTPLVVNIQPTERFGPEPIQIESFRQGYPRLSAFMSSDRDFVVFRSFSHLHTRLLLHKQDEIAELEQRLHAIDQADANAFNLNSRRHDANDERRSILDEIEVKLKAYNECLEDYFKHIKRGPAREKSIENVRNWIHGNKPLVLEESGFLANWEDLICPDHPSDYSGLDNFLDLLTTKLKSVGLLKRTNKSSADEHIILTRRPLLLALTRLISTCLAVSTLVAPIAVLYTITKVSSRLWVIAIFTLVFSLLLCIFTQSRNYEIFSATAAYCAVMVVFIGNLP